MNANLKIDGYLNFVKSYFFYFITIIVYFIVGIILLNNFFRYQINPDGISYINIALNYFKLNIHSAINGYWGPLISWLLIPGLFFHIEPIYTIKVLNLLIGAITIIGIWKFSYNFEMPEWIRKVVIIVFTPAILDFALSVITPDLLLVCILIFYFNIIFNEKYADSLHCGILCGGLGVLAYLSKSYAFVFFPIHFTASNALHYIYNKNKRKRIITNFVFGVLIFITISSIWISLISIKYGIVTFGTSSSFNYALVNPNYHSDYFHSLMKPEDSNFVSFWDDPSYLKMAKWSPLSSINNFMHQIKLVISNIVHFCFIVYSYSFISLFLIILYLFFNKGSFSEMYKDHLLHSIITVVIYITPFLFLFIEPRYIWIIYIFTLLITGNVVQKFIYCVKKKELISDKTNLNYVLLIILSVIMLISFTIMPISDMKSVVHKSEPRYIWIIYIFTLLITGSMVQKFICCVKKKELIFDKINLDYVLLIILSVIMLISFTIMPISDMKSFMYENSSHYKHIQDIGYTLKNDYQIEGNITSNSNWPDSLYISYYDNTRYYGIINDDSMNNNEFLNILKSNNINYFIDWKSHNYSSPFLIKVYKNNEPPGFVLYKVDKK